MRRQDRHRARPGRSRAVRPFRSRITRPAPWPQGASRPMPHDGHASAPAARSRAVPAASRHYSTAAGFPVTVVSVTHLASPARPARGRGRSCCSMPRRRRPGNGPRTPPETGTMTTGQPARQSRQQVPQMRVGEQDERLAWLHALHNAKGGPRRPVRDHVSDVPVLPGGNDPVGGGRDSRLLLPR